MIGAAPFGERGRQFLPGHHKPAIAAKPDDDPVGMDELGGDRGRHAVAHRAAGRPELAAGPAVLQKAVGPAAEIAGVAGDDRVVGQALAQPGHDPAEIERRRVGRAWSAAARPRIRRAPPCATRPSAGWRSAASAAAAAANLRHAGLDRQGRAEHAAQLLGGGVDVDQRLAGVGDAEQRIGLRGDLADPRADRQHQVGLP